MIKDIKRIIEIGHIEKELCKLRDRKCDLYGLIYIVCACAKDKPPHWAATHLAQYRNELNILIKKEHELQEKQKRCMGVA